MSSQLRQVQLGMESVQYRVRESSDAREPRIDVNIHEVTVVLPEGSDIDPESLLIENSRWVLEKKRKYDQYREDAPERVFEPGEMFPYLGERHELVIESRPKNTINDGAIRLRQSAVSQSSIKQVLENFYRSRARDYLTDRAEQYAEEMELEYDSLQLRNQRTRWGSCSSNGILSFNWRLIMAPPAVIDYVVVHELAHLREPNHTDAFWKLVAEHDSDYKRHAEWLEEHSVELIFSKEDL